MSRETEFLRWYAPSQLYATPARVVPAAGRGASLGLALLGACCLGLVAGGLLLFARASRRRRGLDEGSGLEEEAEGSGLEEVVRSVRWSNMGGPERPVA